MIFNIGLYYMIVSNVILDRGEQERLTTIYKKYGSTPLEHDSKFFIDREDIEFLIRIQKLTMSCLKENTRLLKKNNKILKSMLK